MRMAKRKTIAVSDLVKQHSDMTDAVLKSYANHTSLDARLETLNVWLESILFETGNYRGFQYVGGWNEGKPLNEKAHYYYD